MKLDLSNPIVTHCLTIGGTLGTVLVSLLSALASEVFVKRVLYLGLSKIAAKTDNATEKALIQDIGIAWGLVVPAPPTEVTTNPTKEA
jgi:hypothetical protein